jgi:hypothetical protein
VRGEGGKFLTSMGNLSCVVLAALVMTMHVALRHLNPSFTPPATPGKPVWIRMGLYTEFFVHILFLGAVVTGVRNCVPGIRKPSYDDDGTLSIASAQPMPSETVCWIEILEIVAEFSVYLIGWALIYRIA